MSDDLSLRGKRAVVTGASRGIGRAIALALAEAGADVAVSARTKSELDELAEMIHAMGRRAIAVACDVTDPQQVAVHLAGGVLGEFGGIDILVNNAGASGSAKFVGHPDELWHRMLAMNMTSVYYVSKAFAPAMIAQRSGRIITIASIAARVGAKYIAAYTAAKHGALGLVRALAVELLPYNITVNAICPGYVDTPMTQANIANMVQRTGMSEQQARESLERMSPQQRLITPEEVARVAVFLAQDAAASITGQAINVDGGAIMS
ncbi:MAG: Oxidoreductase, short-chain dehydrogenase/reductase family [Ktedonobacterales bacterium]|jgi:NAD(P)-dependent dehydrogenase (short-subunit alcohol dehydrogenase family)|nr:MAG: Oxidoreductase, short-chain dehydrogenase/reductase family [Ktedonobacterales bacterium]